MRETWVRSLGREDPLEKEMATHSSTLAWKIPWKEKPGRIQSIGSQESDTTERLHFHFSLYVYIFQIITLYTLNLHNVICQLYFNKVGK